MKSATAFVASSLMPLFILPATLAAPASCQLKVSMTESAQHLLRPAPSRHLLSYLQKLESLSHCKIQEVMLPMARLIPSFSQHQTQMIIGLMQTPERDRLGKFHPLLKLRPYWISQQAPQDHLIKALQRYDYRVGIVRGAVFPPTLMQTLQTLRDAQQLDEASSEEQAIRMVQAGRNKAFLAVDITYYSLKKQGLLGTLGGWPIKDVAPIKIGIYLNTSTLETAQAGKIASAIQQLSQQRYAEKLIEAHLGYSPD